MSATASAPSSHVIPSAARSAESRDPACGIPLLSVRDARFSYADDRAPVLDGASLEVAAGTCLCLMGMNGCGKSTLIDCILGEHRLSGGSIAVDGRDLAALSVRERARLISYVPQLHERTFPFTVRHLVLMGRTSLADGWGAPGADDEEAVDEALELCGIARLADRPCTALSGGEMQMVLLARALVQQAPLMLADEPTAHLDFKNELVFLETLERLVRERGCAVLMATHEPNQAFHLAEAGIDVRVVVMDAGRIRACGAPEDVLTEEAFARVFGVRAQVWRHDALSRVVPLSTVG